MESGGEPRLGVENASSRGKKQVRSPRFTELTPARRRGAPADRRVRVRARPCVRLPPSCPTAVRGHRSALVLVRAIRQYASVRWPLVVQSEGKAPRIQAPRPEPRSAGQESGAARRRYRRLRSPELRPP